MTQLNRSGIRIDWSFVNQKHVFVNSCVKFVQNLIYQGKKSNVIIRVK